MEVDTAVSVENEKKSLVNGDTEPMDKASRESDKDSDGDSPCSHPAEVSSPKEKASHLKASVKVVENGLSDNCIEEDNQTGQGDSAQLKNKNSRKDRTNYAADVEKECDEMSGDESEDEEKVQNGKHDTDIENGSPKVNGDTAEPLDCDSVSDKGDEKGSRDDSQTPSSEKDSAKDDKSGTDDCDSDDAKLSDDGEKEGKQNVKESDCEDVIDLVNKSDEKNDSEKENTNNGNKNKAGVDASSSTSSLDKQVDSSNDDIQIIGESKVIHISSPSIPNSSSQNIILLPQMGASNSSMLSANNRFTSSSSVFGSNVPGVSSSPYSSGFSNMHQGFIMGGGSSSHPLALSMLPQPVSPPKPKSSLDQIELIRWEIQNRINTRPKYFKPNPTAELGPLAKFLFDIGSDLIKESVYHELVKIQSKKQEDDKLSPKEKEDLEKLKDIERDLNNIVGHLKFRMRKRCRVCHFQTESSNVMYHHKQFPHEDNKNLLCAHCSFVTKQPMNFKFHIEAEHGIQPRVHDKKFFYECDLCQYENNQEQKLNIHKQRCSKQFRPLFNLHPSCLSGAEINLCLENIFYKPIVPKNLKILQQKHLQQQAALAEARRQQAEVAALAAQKNAQAIVKRQRQPPPQPTPHFNSSPITSRPQFQPRLPAPPMSQVRFNSKSPVPPVRPTVANMLKDKQGSSKLSPAFPQHGNAPVGFEVCEICGGYVKDRKALRIHFFYAHRIDLPLNLFDRNQPPLYCATCCVRFWTANGLRKHLDVHAQEKRLPEGFIGEGVSGKCIACGQLVGNIVVHMRVVHNREIHHYTNALMCMFCGASFNSHANVERHVKDVHGTIDIATGAVKMKGKLKSSPPPIPKIVPPPKRPAPSNNSLVKGSVCVLCNLNFGRNVDLTRHCMRMHHTCMKCGMVVIDKSSLLKHTCLSSPSGTRDCSMCSETGFHPAYYVKHLRDKHLRKFSIDVARLSIKVIERWTKRSYPFKKVEEELVEISDSDDDTPIAQFKAATPVKSPRKKARIGPASKINRPCLPNGVDNNCSESCDIDRKGDNVSVKNDGGHSANGSTPETVVGSKRKQSFDLFASPDKSLKRKK